MCGYVGLEIVFSVDQLKAEVAITPKSAIQLHKTDRRLSRVVYGDIKHQHMDASLM